MYAIRVAVLSALLLPALLLSACGQGPDAGKKPDDSKGNDKPAPVITTAVISKPFSENITGIATLRARESVLVTARTAGRIAEILFREGSAVPAGAVLVRLEDEEERAGYGAAKANADLAANRAARINGLHERGLVSQDERDAQKQAMNDAQARSELARVQLDMRTIRAPFAGVLGFRQVSPGTLVQPGDAIVSLDAVDTLRAEFPLPESLVHVVTVGEKSGSTIEGKAAAWPNRTFSGRITLVNTRVDEATRTITVQAQIDNRDRALKPGMLLTVVLAASTRNALFVPEAALLPENSRQYAWRIDAQQTATRVEVSPGVRREGELEIVAGLVAGDRVVIAGQGNLRDGRTVVETASKPEPAP